MAERVVIIGGGLAGMTVAKELGERGLQVVILEASDRLGGKAGADCVNGVYEEHGYHIFPGWYANTRRMLKKLGIEERLRDIDKFHYLQKGQFPKTLLFYPATSLENLWNDFLAFAKVTSGSQAFLILYFLLDLCAERFSTRSFLDRVSENGFLRSRFYATDRISTFHHQTVLQASATPNYEISAMTARKLLQCWMADWLPHWLPTWLSGRSTAGILFSILERVAEFPGRSLPLE